MNWITGGKQGEAKRLLSLLADSTKRDRAAQDLIGLDADAVPVLLEALQTKDLSLLAIYEQILARIPSASQTLIHVLGTAHPIMRARVAYVLSIRKDKSAVPALVFSFQLFFYLLFHIKSILQKLYFFFSFNLSLCFHSVHEEKPDDFSISPAEAFVNIR